MSVVPFRVVSLAVVNVAVALLLAPLFEGAMRKLKAFIHSRQGPPILQPYLDILKLLGKEDLRGASGALYGAVPALTLGAVLSLSLFVPFGAPPPFGFAGDMIVLIYVAAASSVLLMLAAFASGSPYASVGGSREMMLLLSVEPALCVALVVAAVKAGTLSLAGILDWQVRNGPSLSMTLAGIALLFAVQAQAGKLPFDVAEAEQELMGGPLVEQSGPRLALFRLALWGRQFLFALLLAEVFVPWPRTGVFVADALMALLKTGLVLLVVAVVDAVNPRLRIEQAMATFAGVAVSALVALAFAVIGM